MPTYTGLLELRDRGDALDLLCLSSHDEPLADVLGELHASLGKWLLLDVQEHSDGARDSQ